MQRLLIIAISTWFMLVGCQKEEISRPPYSPALMEIPKGFPEMDIPADNQFSIARWALGKKLFYDPIMSVDSSISCAHCHQTDLAFSDGLAVSKGVEDRLGTRNAPSLANVAYHPYFTREGGVPTLEGQILVPIQEHNEFDFNIVLLTERLASDSTYVKMAKAAYDRLPDPFVITRSIACFERSLLSGYSRYDQYVQYGYTEVLSEQELTGMDLFFSERTNCSSCHIGFNFTDYSFKNNGLYGVYEDIGRFRLTNKAEDLAVFKVPSLRNIALTAPYMHDGSMLNLATVIEHYNTGGADHPNKSSLIKPLNLTESEKIDLIAFLESLSDETFVNNSLFKE